MSRGKSTPEPRRFDVEEWGTEQWREKEPPPPPWPRVTAAFILVVSVVLAGLVLVSAAGLGLLSWQTARIGYVVLAAGMWLAALLRLVLPPERAGMLVLRRRTVDVVVLSSLALSASVLALTVPGPV